MLVYDHAQVRVASACPCRAVGGPHGHRVEVRHAPCVRLWYNADWLRVQCAVLRIDSVCSYTEMGEVSV